MPSKPRVLPRFLSTDLQQERPTTLMCRQQEYRYHRLGSTSPHLINSIWTMQILDCLKTRRGRNSLDVQISSMHFPTWLVTLLRFRRLDYQADARHNEGDYCQE